MDFSETLQECSMGQIKNTFFFFLENFHFSIFSEFLNFCVNIELNGTENFKNLLLRNCQLDSLQIYYGASLGQGLSSLFKVLKNFHFSIFKKCLKFSLTLS